MREGEREMNALVSEHVAEHIADPKVERIVVALDSSQQSRALLQAAVQMAAQLQAELQGVFIEDANLLRLCSLPFSQDIGRFSATARQLDSAAIERQFRTVALALQQTLAQIASAVDVRWSFRVARGNPADELLAAAQDAQLVSLARAVDQWGGAMDAAAEQVIRRAGRPVLVMGRRDGVTEPFTLVYSGSQAAQRALKLTLRLARRGRQAVQVVLAPALSAVEQTRGELAASFATQNQQVRFTHPHDATELAQRLQLIRRGTVILPAEYAELVARLSGPVIVTP